LKTRVVQVDPDQPSPDALREATVVLASGGLVAFATETVYGLGAVATDPEAVARIFAAKGRPAFNPLIVHVAGIDQAREFAAAWPPSAQRLAQSYWPGPLTLILPHSLKVPMIVTGGRETVGLRVPAPAVARGLIDRVGQPLAAPSANRSNRVSPTCAEHVLGDLDGRIDMIIDSGPTSLGLESTVLDMTSSPLRILRPGPIGAGEIEACLHGIDRVESRRLDAADGESAPSPGLQAVHYAPTTPAFRVQCAEELASIRWSGRGAVLVLGLHDLPELPPSCQRIDLPEPAAAARELYAILHRLDLLGLDQIVIVMPPDRPEWSALRDRLMRAAQPVPS
jgi:L-threonylcarbamoyladenylate synthase